jgi:hypothetical protein
MARRHTKEIRWRAFRRLGEMIKAQKATVGLAQGRRSDLVPRETKLKSQP